MGLNHCESEVPLRGKNLTQLNTESDDLAISHESSNAFDGAQKFKSEVALMRARQATTATNKKKPSILRTGSDFENSSSTERYKRRYTPSNQTSKSDSTPKSSTIQNEDQDDDDDYEDYADNDIL